MLISIGWGRDTGPAREAFGLKGSKCDACGRPFEPDDDYVTLCSPRNQALMLYHDRCTEIRLAERGEIFLSRGTRRLRI